MDPAQIIDTARQAAPYALLILAATTALAHALQQAARAFERYAAKTPGKDDDAAAHRLVKAADAVAGALDGLAKLLPRIGFGPRE